MAAGPKPGSLSWRFAWVLALSAWYTLDAYPQRVLSLKDLGARKPPDSIAVHLHETVTVRGTVNATAFHFPPYTLVSIQDGEGGAILEGAPVDPRLDALRPGDQVEVQGEVTQLAGQVLVRVRTLVHTGKISPPRPLEVRLADLNGFRYLGRLATTEGQISQIGTSTAGPFFQISSGKVSYQVFIPWPPGEALPSLAGYARGDKIRAAGVAVQYCPYPPYDHFFELLASPEAVVRTERSALLPPLVLAGAIVGLFAIVLFFWSRERRIRGQREKLRKTYRLGEQILGSDSAETVMARIEESLPELLGVTRLHLYVYNRAAKTLDAVASGQTPPVSISLSAPPGGIQAGAVACFHYRTLLVIPDIARSPFPIAIPDGARAPRSLLFVPINAQGEVIGVLELDQNDRLREFDFDEQELVQHLANQIGVALRLLEQRSVREQLFRTEKLAAIGRLISGIVNDLQTPLASIPELANHALERARSSAVEHDLTTISAEAQKAAAIMARLVSFAAEEQVQAKPVSISNLLRTLIDFREGDCKASGIRVRDLTAREPLMVLGAQGQLEQVFVNLMVHAEQALATAPQKVITVRTSILGKRLVVEIAFTALPEWHKPAETAAVLGVTRGIVAGHGGEVRLIEKNNADPRFEVELPAISREHTGPVAVDATPGRAPEPGRRTALLIEPEDGAQRQLIALLAARGYRVVPVGNADTALELSHRMHFDVVFCSVRAPGLNWVELSEHVHSRVGAFILLSDGYDSELAADFEGDDRYVLPKPVQAPELDRVLQLLQPAQPKVQHGVA